MTTGPEPFEIRFDYLPTSPLANGWKIAYGTGAEFSNANKPKWLVMRTRGQKFAMDYSIPSQAQDAYRVVFDAEFRNDAMFFVQVELVAGSVIENWWLAFVRGSQSGSPSKVSAGELKFPIAPVDGKTRFDINIRRCVAEGLPGKAFGRIKQVRVRGDFNLSPLLLLQHDLAVRTGSRLSRLSLTDEITLAGVLVTLLAVLIAPFNEDVRHFLKEKYHEMFSTEAPATQPLGTPTQKPPTADSPAKTHSFIAEAGTNPSELRQRHGVRRLSQFESGKTTDEIPSGSFGFAYPSSFEHSFEPNRIPIELFSSEGIFEIHKLRDGSLVVLGYVGTESYLRLQEGAQAGDSFSLYSGPFKAFSHLVSIPVNRIECSRVRPVASVRVADCKAVGQ
jgi:hypothetical protein